MQTVTACAETDWGCADAEWVASLDPDLKAKAEVLAWETLRSLTAYRLSNCPITVRPCAASCWSRSSWQTAPVGGRAGGGLLQPQIVDGNWINACGCVANDCSCSSVPEVILPGPVGEVVEVTIDGVIVDPSTYRVDDGVRLVRMLGQSWPVCQDMSQRSGDVRTFEVTYHRGIAPNDMSAWAAGMLAVEFAKACTGGKCSLPRGVQSIARQGVSITIQTDMFEGGSTGIPVVDAWVRTINPNRLKQTPGVYSPDVRQPRTTTWARGV